jgi:hypothetical protein
MPPPHACRYRSTPAVKHDKQDIRFLEGSRSSDRDPPVEIHRMIDDDSSSTISPAIQCLAGFFLAPSYRE